MPLRSLVSRLMAEAERANERRMLVLAGDRDRGFDAAYDVIEQVADPPPTGSVEGVTLVTARKGFRYTRVAPAQADKLLGTTQQTLVLDCHEAFSANSLGAVTGVVDGGGLLVLLTPPLDQFPTAFSALVDRVLVPPYAAVDVGNRFRKRLATTLETHPGIAIVDCSNSELQVVRNGLTDPQSAVSKSASHNQDAAQPTHNLIKYSQSPFPDAAFEACLTGDQARAVDRLSRLAAPGNAVVVDADRGRGKSSAAGLAAGALAASGRDVLVTAPAVDNALELLERATELLVKLDAVADDTSPVDSVADVDANDSAADGLSTSAATGDPISTTTGGRLRFLSPADAAAAADTVDVLIVDEAAAISVGLLTRFLDAAAVACCTTVHGYEGTGRGFTVRFRDRLTASAHRVTDVSMDEPIRYARGDPIESWLFRTLCLDAAPPASQLVDAATPETVRHQRLDRDALATDEPLLRSVFGLLVSAHYKTEPTDLLRLLDAPNVAVCVLTHDGHVVSVALLAREGGLDRDTRRQIYRGGRVRGNMLPDVLTSQLRDPDAAEPEGYRIMRIATHHAARSRGLGSHLLSCCHRAFGTDVDWFGVGYGATPELLDFWRDNAYRTVHLSTTRNDTSGEHSALMLRPCSQVGRRLTDRHVGWFRDRVGGVLADALSSLDADVVRGALRAAQSSGTDSTGLAITLLTERDWRLLAGVGYGPGTYETSPGVFRTLALAHLFDPRASLSARQERLLVRKVLQCESWESVAMGLDYPSTSQCMREFGTIARRFCERVGDPAGIVADEKRRYDVGDQA